MDTWNVFLILTRTLERVSDIHPFILVFSLPFPKYQDNLEYKFEPTHDLSAEMIDFENSM